MLQLVLLKTIALRPADGSGREKVLVEEQRRQGLGVRSRAPEILEGHHLQLDQLALLAQTRRLSLQRLQVRARHLFPVAEKADELVAAAWRGEDTGEDGRRR